ncbi:MAG TPA: hypothetical protein VES73_01910 [Lamprocystis sp. (in: g-proteobacteria)]|nr:hypothetical protein [Lamprocystis sp. (in: g-proteobacteria)]
MVDRRGTQARCSAWSCRTFYLILNRGVLLVFCLLALAAGGWSLASGVASVLAWQAGEVGAGSPASAVSAGGEQDHAIRGSLGVARRLDPKNPRYLEQLAQHLERLAMQDPPRGPLERERLAQAHGLNLQAAGRRPTWPLGLTSVLRTGFKLGHFGPEFTRRYARAAELGRSEPAALRALVDLGLVTWPLLEPVGRQQVRALLRHGLRVNPDHVLARAVEVRQGAVVEPLIASDPALQRRYGVIRARAQPPG